MSDASEAAMPGASVTLSSNQGERVYVTDREGRFRAPYLTPGLYSLRVEGAGHRAIEQHDIDVRLGQQVELTFALAPDTFSGSVDVAGTAPIIDFTSVATGMAIDSGFLAQVPVGRRLSDALYLSAGVSSSGGAGAANPSISGASGLENQYVVDGVNITDPRYGGLGVYSSTYGSIGSGVTYDFIDEIQVRTGGAEAEYSQSTGGMVSVITKSGSNDWHGGAFVYTSPEWLEGSRRSLSLESGAVNTTGAQAGEVGFSLGGPIVRDRVFFFAAGGHQQEWTEFLAPEGFPLRGLGSVDRKRTIVSYAGKATVMLHDSHRLDASFFGDPADGDTGPQAASAMAYRSTGAFSSLSYGGHNQSLRYHGIMTASWLLEASAARAKSSFRESPSVDEWQVIDETTQPPTTSGGKGSYSPGNDGENLQLQVKSSHLLGRHDIRYGASFEDIRYDSISGTTGPQIILANGMQTASGVRVRVLSDPTYGVIYRVLRAGLQRTRESSQQYLGLFAQDKLRIGSRLTVSAGLRYEEQELVGPGATFTFDDNWAPRLGAVLDPTGSGRVKLYASHGLFFAKIPNDMAVLVFQGGGRVLRADYFDAGLTEPVPDGVEALGTTIHLMMLSGRTARVDPEAKSTYIRETVLGAEIQALPLLNLGIRYHHRDMPRVLEDVGTAAMMLYFTGDLGSVEYFITNPRDGYPATVNGLGSFERPIHTYDAVELTAEKRYSNNWSGVASYRWSQLRGNYEGFFRNDNLQSRPAMTSLFDFPTNDPSFTEIGVPEYGFRGDIRYLGELGAGPLPNDRTHQLKVYGSYTFDGGLNLGMGLNAATGRPLTPMAADPYYNRTGDIPEAPRGSGIVTEDGFKRRTPFEWSFDLHADYALPLKKGRLVLAADVFNLFDVQRPVEYDQNTERISGVVNPDFGSRTLYQDPRCVRLGARFEF